MSEISVHASCLRYRAGTVVQRISAILMHFLKIQRALALLLVAFGCGRAVSKVDGSAPAQPARALHAGGGAKPSDDPQVAETIALHGFEKAAVNDPEIRKMRDGTLLVVFNCMPPCSTEDGAFGGQSGLGPYAHFDAEMQRATGVDVFWEDREFFRIRQPRADTIQRVKDFVAHYHERPAAK